MREVYLVPLIFIIFLTPGCRASCNEDKLIKFLVNFQVWSPESIITLTIDELGNDMCGKLDQELKMIDKTYKRCKILTPKSLYVQLITGLHVLNDKLCCYESGFFREYQMYNPCLCELKQDFESCSGPADWIEDTDIVELCKVSKSIVGCYYVQTAKVCGEPAAIAVGSLMTDIVKTIVGGSCKDIDKYPVVRDVMPARYIERSYAYVHKSSLVLLLLESMLYALLIIGECLC